MKEANVGCPACEGELAHDGEHNGADVFVCDNCGQELEIFSEALAELAKAIVGGEP